MEDINRKYRGGAHISVDRLVVLGLISRIPKLPSTPGGPGGLLKVVIPSIVGLNLYADATGDIPRALAEEEGKSRTG